MHSLTELRNFFVARNIQVEEFAGWYLKVGRDKWTLSHDVFYCNDNPQSTKEKVLVEYCKTIEPTPEKSKRKWKAINSGRLAEGT